MREEGGRGGCGRWGGSAVDGRRDGRHPVEEVSGGQERVVGALQATHSDAEGTSIQLSHLNLASLSFLCVARSLS